MFLERVFPKWNQAALKLVRSSSLMLRERRGNGAEERILHCRNIVEDFEKVKPVTTLVIGNVLKL